MTDSELTDEIEPDRLLKQDRRGRVLTTKKQRLALLREFENSALSGPEFARVAGIKYQTFASWRQQQKRVASGDENKHSSEMARLHFVEAVLPPLQDNGLQVPAAALKLGLPDGLHLELSHRDQLPLTVALIKAYQG